MNSNIFSLYDLAKWKNGVAFKNIHFSDGGKPIIKIAELKNGITEQTQYTQQQFDSDAFLTRGDMVFSWSGNPKTSIDVFWYDLPDGWLNQHIFKVSPINGVDSNYLFYLLKVMKPIFASIASNKQTTGLGHITIKDLKEIRVKLPPLEKQRSTGAYLRNIDLTIECNNQINHNLEQQAQAIFLEWLNSHLNMSTEVSLDEVCLKVTDGSHFSPKDDSLSTIPMLSVKDMKEFDFDLTSCKHISDENYQKMITNDCVPKIDDILVAKDGSYLKEIFICNEQRQIAILSSIAILRPDRKMIFPEILLAFLKSPDVLKKVRDNYVSGSALPRVVLKDFKKLCFSLPPIEEQKKIAPILVAFRLMIATSIAENQILAALRNSLLPKLMSGEIDTSNIKI